MKLYSDQHKIPFEDSIWQFERRAGKVKTNVKTRVSSTIFALLAGGMNSHLGFKDEPLNGAISLVLICRPLFLFGPRPWSYH